MPFANWRARTASGVIQSEAKGLRTEGAAGDKSQTLKTLRPGEDGHPNSRSQRENLPFLHLLVPLGLGVEGLHDAHPQ